MPIPEFAPSGCFAGGVIPILNSGRLLNNMNIASTLARDQTIARNIPVPETVHRNPVEIEIGAVTRKRKGTDMITGTATTVLRRGAPLDQVLRKTC